MAGIASNFEVAVGAVQKELQFLLRKQIYIYEGDKLKNCIVDTVYDDYVLCSIICPNNIQYKQCFNLKAFVLGEVKYYKDYQELNESGMLDYSQNNANQSALDTINGLFSDDLIIEDQEGDFYRDLFTGFVLKPEIVLKLNDINLQLSENPADDSLKRGQQILTEYIVSTKQVKDRLNKFAKQSINIKNYELEEIVICLLKKFLLNEDIRNPIGLLMNFIFKPYYNGHSNLQAYVSNYLDKKYKEDGFTENYMTYKDSINIHSDEKVEREISKIYGKLNKNEVINIQSWGISLEERKNNLIEQNTYIRGLINELSMREVEVILLKYWFNYSTSLIAERLRITNKTVLNTLITARNKIKNMMINDKDKITKELKNSPLEMWLRKIILESA